MAGTGMDVTAFAGVAGDLGAWAARARWSAAVFTGAAGAAAGGQGADPAGVVTAALGPDGRLCGVAVADDWPDRLDTAALGPAVVAAVVSATRDRLTRWTAALSQTDRARVDAPPSPAVAPPDDLRAVRSTAVRAAVADLADLVLRAADEHAARALPRPAATAATGTSPVRGGEVRVTVDGGHVCCVDVEVEPYPGHAAPLARAILAATGDAYRAWDARDPGAAVGPAGQALLARVADPAALLTSLGLAAGPR